MTLIRGGDAASPRLTVEARANVLVRADDEVAFRQAMAMLERPMRRGTVRLLALEPGAPRFLPGLRPRAAEAEMPQPEAVDPYKLSDVFRSIAGSTALVTGAVDGKYLLFEPADGGEQSLLIDDMRAAAVAGDVDLVIFDAGVSRQPGCAQPAVATCRSRRLRRRGGERALWRFPRGAGAATRAIDPGAGRRR